MSRQYSDIIVTPVFGPIDTANTPNQIPYQKLGIQNCNPANVQLFYPSQEPVYSENFTNSRQQYIRTESVSKKTEAIQTNLAKTSPSHMFYCYSSQTRRPVSSHVNYIGPQDSSLYINRKKAIAVGQSSFKVGLPQNTPYTTKNYYPSGTATSLQRLRSSGSVAPKKKGSIFNTTLKNAQIYSLGSLPRQTY
jgi:hypothetical protein